MVKPENMDLDMFCSVVMPVHNGQKFLQEAIESVIAQTHTNFEFIIVENCSNDLSVEIIKSFNDSRIRLIIEDDCGIVQSYNRGFKEAKGEYVFIHDQDDISSPNRMELQLQILVKENIDICGTSFTIIDKNGDKIKNIFPPIDKSNIINTIFFDPFALFNPTLALKKEVLTKLDLYDIKTPIGADCDFIFRSFEFFTCKNISNILLKYRHHKASTSSSYKKLEEISNKSIALKYFEKYKTMLSDPEFILSKIYYSYGAYFTTCKFIVKSIKKNGANLEKMKYLSFSSIFLIPIFLLRKRGLFYNKYLNKFFRF